MPPSDEGGVKIYDFDGGRDRILYTLNLSLSLAEARQLPRQREPKQAPITFPINSDLSNTTKNGEW